MEWNHLPLAGGWYDQHPGFVDAFDVIMTAEGDAEKRRQAKQKQQRQPVRGGKGR